MEVARAMRTALVPTVCLLELSSSEDAAPGQSACAQHDTHTTGVHRATCADRGARLQMACDKNSPHHGHICVADEHFVASLLSAYKMRDTFDRIGMMTFVDWKSVGGWHPKTFYTGDVLQSIYAMRTRSGPAGCARPLTCGTLASWPLERHERPLPERSTAL